MKLSCISYGGFIALFVSCRAVGPNYQIPAPPELPAAFQSGETTSANEVRWWEHFHDATLTRLIQTARTANLDLEQAGAHLREAEALARSVQLTGFNVELRNSSLLAGWELDLFGKIRRGREVAQAGVESAAALRDAALVSISAEVATTYLELRGSQQAEVWARRSVESSERILNFSRVALRLGRATQIDTLRIEGQMAENRAALPLLRQEQQIALARLAVLTGKAPGVLDLQLGKPAPVPRPPDSVAVGLPADLLRNRPDVRSAERDLAAAVAAIGVETADLYPQLSLGGSLGYSVGKPSGFLWNGGPNLSWAALNLPQVRTRVAAAQARADGALAHYRQTVLRAVEEATTALSSWENQRERRDHLFQAAALTRTVSTQSQQRMDAGVLTLPEVLAAEQTWCNTEKELAESETATATSLVAVYRALGGGWQLP